MANGKGIEYHPESDGLTTFVSPSGWYSLMYPETWQVDTDSDCATFTKRDDGLGALQISAYKTPGEESALDILLEHLDDGEIVATTIVDTSVDGQETATCSYETNGSLWKVWCLTKDGHFLFVTYNRDAASKGIEDSDISSILASIRVGG